MRINARTVPNIIPDGLSFEDSSGPELERLFDDVPAICGEK
jgi:hypothetical protein